MAPSPALAIGVLAAYLVGAVGAFFLFIFLGDRSLGTQIATVLVYTYFAFWYIFVPKDDPRNKTVQQQIPRLIAIHSGFLTFLFIGQTVLFGMKPRLPTPMKPGNSDGGKGPQLKTNARSDEGHGD